MKTENIKQLVQEACNIPMLMPVRAYYIGEHKGFVDVKMPLVKDGHKVHRRVTLPDRLVYYTFNDHKNKEVSRDNELLFMLVPHNLWVMLFGQEYLPGSTWVAPQAFRLQTSFHGDG